MYEKIRTAAAVLLLTACLAICLVSADGMRNSSDAVYRSAGIRKPPLTAWISTEVKGPVRVNTADSEELTELNGIGETLAALIILEREQNGPFYYAEDLTAVRGIGPATLAGFREMLDLTTDERGK